jgi:serine/threonine protein kinase
LIINAKYRYREEGAISESAKRFISRMLQPKPEERAAAAELLKDSWLN